MGLEGEAGFGPVKANVDADFGDLLEASDSLFGFSGRLEVGRGRVSGFVDGVYAKVAVENRSGGAGVGNIDVKQEIGVIDFGLAYRVYEGDLLGSHQPAQRESSVDVYAGARWSSVELDLNPTILASRTSENEWVDPIIGVRLTQPGTEHLRVRVWGDVGGFGAASDLTWSATAALGWDVEVFGLDATVYGGYRAIGWDHTHGSGPQRFKWDVILHGPALGFTIRF